jgi:DNA-binding Lrp family transcriptional regulator
MKEIDYKILAHIRNDAGKPVPKISKETGIPNSTIYEKVNRQFKKLVKRRTALLDFSNLGFHSIVHFALRCREGNKDEVRKFLIEHPRINSLHRVNFGWDFLAEGIFRNIGEAEDFRLEIEQKFSPYAMERFSVVEELKREQFLTDSKHIE